MLAIGPEDLQILYCPFRTIMALGYYITMDKPPSRIKSVRLPNEPFLQSNGYKPAPLDLSAIALTPKMEELVDQLAENTHNLWAKERIQQGWTYGLNEVIMHLKYTYFLQCVYYPQDCYFVVHSENTILSLKCIFH
jgi:hypothetical protein